ncbi:hypothetical protein [Microcoleus sp. FACHB-68]|uniref:hypothetical protein n=1 Tax=Microcoleus sp. FACHB-68 TaxID=2692826 RepID=UPI001683F3C6|nr:hypothetical protein [Microcoleus sp. FACHB-68]MBD1936414.1 hypothetical protein [Microcoleus sp. FACHB-68]
MGHRALGMGQGFANPKVGAFLSHSPTQDSALSTQVGAWEEGRGKGGLVRRRRWKVKGSLAYHD